MGYEKGDRGGSRRRGAGGAWGLGNVYTIPEMVYSGALCDEGMLTHEKRLIKPSKQNQTKEHVQPFNVLVYCTYMCG